MAGAARNFAAPLAVCCLLIIALLIASTIVLALIPVYLSIRNVDVGNTSPTEALSLGYASDQVGARSDTIDNLDSVSTQLKSKGVFNNQLDLNTGNFISATASSKKRQFSTDTQITCEKPTGLSGDILVLGTNLTYPNQCLGVCRTRFKTKVLASLRNNYVKFTVTINFLIAGVRVVTLQFCGIFGTGTIGCTTEAKNNAYLMDANNIIYQFNILNYNVAQVGSIGCSTSSNLTSIALARDGILWAAFQDGTLFRYNVKSKVCSATTFAANQNNFTQFSMTFLKSTTDSSETLYVSTLNNSNGTLGTINTSTFTLSVVGNYNALNHSASIAGTTSGSLYGLFQSNNDTIAQIQPSNAQILSQYPLNISSNNFAANAAFTIGNGIFFLFQGNGTGNGTSIYIFNPSTSSTTLVSNITQTISGATSSSCLGTS